VPIFQGKSKNSLTGNTDMEHWSHIGKDKVGGSFNLNTVA